MLSVDQIVRNEFEAFCLIIFLLPLLPFCLLCFSGESLSLTIIDNGKITTISLSWFVDKFLCFAPFSLLFCFTARNRLSHWSQNSLVENQNFSTLCIDESNCFHILDQAAVTSQISWRQHKNN